MSNYRQRRGAETQRTVRAAWRADGWPYAEDAGAGRNGADLLGTPGLFVEIRARREVDLVGWLRETAAKSGNDLPLLVIRPDGSGPTTVDDWPAVVRHGDLRRLLRQAGYGDPLEAEQEPSCPHVFHSTEPDEACAEGCGLVYSEWNDR